MSGPAKVTSTAAIEDFGVALAKFEQRSQGAVDTLLAELRRAMQWLEHDCPAHWKKETRRAEEGVQQARIELERCQQFTVAGERPTCREQKAALKRAQQRLAYCREKQERVRHWKGKLQHEQFAYEARVGQLQRLLELELPTARGKLQIILRRLEEYQQARAPAADPGQISGDAGGQSAAGKIVEES